LLDVDEVDAPELPFSWNVAPTQPVSAVATSSGGAGTAKTAGTSLTPALGTAPSSWTILVSGIVDDSPA
jgi:hypothetical protein